MTALKNIPFSQEIPTADENNNMDLGDITMIVGESGVPTCGAIIYKSVRALAENSEVRQRCLTIGIS